MTDGERLQKFDADFERLKKNRETVPLDQLRTRYADNYNALLAELEAGADWFAETYIDLLVGHFPQHPKDAAGNEWLDKRIAAIREQEAKPGGLVERYRAALLERLDMEEYRQLVWEIYNRLEVEAFDPYWQRHNKWVGPPGRRWIYNDITRKYWWPKTEGYPASGCWINHDYTGHDSRFPPKIRRTYEMERQELISRFEAEMGKINRPGVDKLMKYIQGSDFYTAPASTKFHLSCEGGLLQHSLNVLDALRGLLVFNPITGLYEYQVAGKVAAEFTVESVTIAALLHDICKTYFYGTAMRNVKNEKTNRWEKQPYYTVDDKMPLGHGPKSAMIIKQYMELTTPEMYAIWHHMGMNGDRDNDNAVGASFEKYPLALALHTADMMASRLMEGEKENKALFAEPSPATAGDFGEDPGTGEPDAPPADGEWQDAPPIKEGAK